MKPVILVMKHAKILSLKFSTEIMHLPLTFGGYGVHKMYKFMAMEQATIFLSSLRIRDNTGRKALMSIEFRKLESGLSKSILGDVREYDHLLTETWVKKIVKSLGKL